MSEDVHWLEGRLSSPHKSVLSYNSEKFLVEFAKINILRKNKITVFIPIAPFLVCQEIFNKTYLSSLAVVSRKPHRSLFPNSSI